MPGTSITEEHRRAFQALTGGRFRNLCLVSCFVDGERTVAIATVNAAPSAEAGSERDYIISPTAAMPLIDHDGRET